jgi:hypothetical protein
MLDWDKPLSQQAPEVQKALVKLRETTGATYTDKARGESILELLGKATQGDSPFSQRQITASQQLRGAGIPGVRYLDQGSRGAGQGSSNFVVFPGEESLLTILERNGQPIR